MTPTKKPAKRRLPDWMEAMQSLTKKAVSADSSASPLSCSNTDVPDAAAACNEPVKKRTEDLQESVSRKDKYLDNVEGDSSKAKRTVTRKVSKSRTFLSSKKFMRGEGSSDLGAAQSIIAQSMPLLTFKGTIIYSYQDSDCACICLDILSSLSESDKTVIGFDMEWPVSFHQGLTNKTSLIQMCVAEKTCYLFHVSAMSSFPTPLKSLLTDSRVVLTGLNIEADLWKLERDFDLKVKPLIDRGSIVDVGDQANNKLKSSERWALEGLCRNVLKYRLDKDGELRCGDWTEVPLTKEQKLYAATDAYAGLLLYKHLIDK